MGQSTSRSSREAHNPNAAGPSTSTNASPSPRAPQQPSASTNRRSIRSAARRSIIHTLGRRHSLETKDPVQAGAQERVRPHTTSDASTSRRPWRFSRKKKEPEVIEAEWERQRREETAITPIVPEAEGEQDTEANSGSSPASDVGKGKERTMPEPTHDTPAEPASSGSGADRTPSTPNVVDAHDGEASSSVRDFLAISEDAAKDTLDDSAEAQRESTPPPSSAPSDPPRQPAEPASQTSPADRRFPPAGTLVVVQGVVHTTDVSAAHPPPPSSSTPLPTRPSSAPANNGSRRLSSINPRPMASRRSSYVSPDSTSPSSGVSDSAAEASARTSTSATSAADGDIPADEASGDSPSEPQNPNRGNSSLSPSSIDVLGTLLSVATAATAASLVSGTSDPLFGSGLAAPGSTSLPSSAPPSAGLDSLGAMPGLHPSNRNGNRVRNAWGSIRDRLGLHAGRGAANAASPASSAPSAAPSSGADPRAQLLAEMARAFHLGMGLDNQDNSPPADNSPPSGNSRSSEPLTIQPWPQNLALLTGNPDPNQPLPAENSFERFLMDLQVDLRRTLAEGPRSGLDAPSAESEDPADLLPWPVPVEDLFEEDETAIAGGPPPSVLPAISAASQSHDSMPSLEDVSNSDTEDVDEEEEILSDSGLPSPNDDEAIPTPPSGPSPSEPAGVHELPPRATSGAQRRGSDINWWRMYRFPPMTAPPGHAPASPFAPRTGAPASFVSPSSSPLTTPPQPGTTAEQTSAPSTPTTADTATSNSATADAPADNVIVPVIVVGLQSVAGRNFGQARQRGPEQDDAEPEAPSNAASLTEDGMDAQENDLSGGRPGTPRGRPWRSRAAEAIRGLRPGRRGGAADGSRAADGSGSTTFFIYVIGGYYPPNHHLVTGNDPLGSFEALWELAELLGQVKPPTVTKEEIAKSGLEVLHAGDLAEYEKDSRVASNCVDRCLICLEDYVPEDELRLLTCRHAFHKGCVDQWLETGRNNCPACRSQGVATAA